MLNIVNPNSTISQESAPFTLFGNRGELHKRSGLQPRVAENRWIYCVTSALRNPKDFMSPGSLTELFFLDEATALAAGHRPCGRCNKGRFDEFLKICRKVRGNSKLTIEEFDAELHTHRIVGNERRAYLEDASKLPAGVMIRELGRDQPLLLHSYVHPKDQVNWCVYPWTSHGYGLKEGLPAGEVEVLTPRPIVEVMLAGFNAGPEKPLLAW